VRFGYGDSDQGQGSLVQFDDLWEALGHPAMEARTSVTRMSMEGLSPWPFTYRSVRAWGKFPACLAEVASSDLFA
jgi:hypothetical protein